MKKYDILVFQETKTVKLDHLNLPNGYSYKAKHRENVPESVVVLLLYTKAK